MADLLYALLHKAQARSYIIIVFNRIIADIPKDRLLNFKLFIC